MNFFKLLFLGLFCSISIEIKAQINTPEDCIDAYRICDATQNYYFEVNGIGNIDDANGALGLYCLSQANIAQWENNSAWFIFTAQYTGEFGLLICPDITTEDWNWALFNNNPNCSDLANNTYWLRCEPGLPVSVVNGCTGMGFKNGFWGGKWFTSIRKYNSWHYLYFACGLQKFIYRFTT